MRQVHFYCSVLILGLSPVMAEPVANVELLASSCAACHGTRGHSVTEIPSLAGIDKTKFKHEINAFLSGERKATVMHQHAVGYSQAEIDALSTFFSQQ